MEATRMLSGPAENNVRLIRTYSNSLNTVAVSRDREYLLVGGSDIRLFSVSTGREIRRFPGRPGVRVVSVGFVPDNTKRAYAGLATGTLGIYRFDAPGRVIATGKRKTPDGQWERYNIEEGTAEYSFAAAAGSTVGDSVWLGTGMGGFGVGFRGQHLIQKWSWGDQGIVQSWGVAGELPCHEPDDEDADIPAVQRAITAASVSPSGSVVVGAVVYEYWSVFNRLGRRDAYLYQLNTETGESQRRKRSNFAYYDLSWDHTGNRVLATGTAPEFEMRDESWRLIHRFQGHDGEVRCARFLSDNDHIISAGTDSTLRLWRTSGQQIACYRWDYGAYSALALSSDGRTVYAVGDSPVIAEWVLPI